MRSLVLVGLLGLAACGSSDGGGADAGDDLSVGADLAPAADLYFASACGRPGDKGNSKGVGAYCDNDTPCDDTLPAFFCSHTFNADTYFCTVPSTCTPPVDTDTCGEDTVCQCQGGTCGCSPIACQAPPEG